MKKNEGTDSKEILHGTVLRFNVKSGYGFIQSNDGVNYFIHQSNINMKGFRKLTAGDVVEFQTSSRDGEEEQAVNVTVLFSVKNIRAKLRKDGYKLTGFKIPICTNPDNTIVHNTGWMISQDGFVVSGEATLSLEEVVEWVKEEQ